MAPNPVLIGAAVGGAQVAPSDATFGYSILSAPTLAFKGGLRGVTNEPTFHGTINNGPAALALILDSYPPATLAYGDVVRVTYPSGQVAGYWRYEGNQTKIEPANHYQITLMPLVEEATNADFTANYSGDTTQPTAALGAATFDKPVLAALPRTMHLKAGTILSDGVAYGYSWNNGTVKDTLDQAIKFGGPGWWWFTDALGNVTLRNSSPYNHVVTMGREAISGEWVEDIHALYNGQPVTGGQPAGGTVALTAFASDINPGNPYSVVNLGRRTAKPYSDSSLLDQAAVNAMASTLLGYSERVSRHRKLHLTNYTIRRPQPGDAVTVRISDPDPSLLTNPASVVGPFLITEVTEHGGYNVFDLVISADMTVPVSAMQPLLAQQIAIDKLMQNPVRSAVSPDGSTGNLGPGAYFTAPPGATQYPSSPTGLSGTTGIDSIAQTNNAYVNLTWSPSAAIDVVTGYELRWRKGGDTQYYQGRSGVTSFKVGNLIPGFTYSFSIRAQNDIGNYSAWSAEISVTTGQQSTSPAKTTGLVGIRTPRGALVQWNGNTEADLQGYLLQVSVGNAPFAAINPSPDLKTSAYYVAPSGTPQQTVLVFRVAAVNWSGLQSPWSSASANIPTDGTYYDEIMSGNITATGTLTGGLIRTGATGARIELDNAGERLYDGGTTDWGAGAGITSQLKTQDGSAFFKGTVSASKIQSATPSVNPNLSIDTTGAPVLKVTDSTGLVRVQIGSLPDGTYGEIVKNAAGNTIFDTLGLQTIMTLIGGGSFGTSAGNVQSNTYVAVPGTTISFSVSRSTNVLVLSQGTFSFNSGTAAGACKYGTVVIQVFAGGTQYAISQGFSQNNGSLTTPASTQVATNGSFASSDVVSLAAGSYSVRFLYSMDSGTNSQFDFVNGKISVFLLGG